MKLASVIDIERKSIKYISKRIVVVVFFFRADDAAEEKRFRFII